MQVILEFLFYIRDKTIKTIHILDKSALSFFEYLNENPFENQEDKKEKNTIYNEGEEDDLIEELKIYSQPKYSPDSNSINLNVFNGLKIKSKEEIDIGSALNYIFFYKPKTDYTKEIKYLYDNIVLPLEKITKNKDEQDKIETNNWLNLQNQIQYIYDRIDSLFKNDPFYNDIIKYFDICEKSYGHEFPKEMLFYDKFVDDFKTFKELHKLKKEVDNSITIIEETNNNLIKLQNIKEKYKFILEEIKGHLGFNFEEYSSYYDEWQKNNPNFALKTYKFNELSRDLKRLIPENEKIKVAGKDKKNFLLILFLFQNNYFLKDYL